MKVKSKEKEFKETLGLVDLQVNGFGGVDFNSIGLTPEKLQKSLEAILATGVLTFLPTIITESEKHMKICLSCRLGHSLLKESNTLIWEKYSPGGNPRKGILGLDTTRGDRLFVSLLGSAFIHLAWLGLVGSMLWIATIICVAYFVIVFKYV